MKEFFALGRRRRQERASPQTRVLCVGTEGYLYGFYCVENYTAGTFLVMYENVYPPHHIELNRQNVCGSPPEPTRTTFRINGCQLRNGTERNTKARCACAWSKCMISHFAEPDVRNGSCLCARRKRFLQIAKYKSIICKYSIPKRTNRAVNLARPKRKTPNPTQHNLEQKTTHANR